jgi:hypothetical protein
MAENKKSFILYCDQKGVWDKLNNEQAGKLIKHIIAYVNDEDPVTDDFITELAFEPIKQQLKRDLKQWAEIKENRSIAGKAGAEARWHKIADDGKRISGMAKMAVNDNVNVNVTVNDTVNDTVNVNDRFIIVENQRILNPLPILEYYEVQLNGTQSENGNIAWKPMVDSWFNQHLGEDFAGGMHVKNSFKKHYLANLNKRPDKMLTPRKKAFEL